MESKYKRTAALITWHVRMLLRHVGHLEAHKVHDDTFGRSSKRSSLKALVSATTINRRDDFTFASGCDCRRSAASNFRSMPKGAQTTAGLSQSA
jgi:hypothetical protein